MTGLAGPVMVIPWVTFDSMIHGFLPLSRGTNPIIGRVPRLVLMVLVAGLVSTKVHRVMQVQAGRSTD